MNVIQNRSSSYNDKHIGGSDYAMERLEVPEIIVVSEDDVRVSTPEPVIKPKERRESEFKRDVSLLVIEGCKECEERIHEEALRSAAAKAMKPGERVS